MPNSVKSVHREAEQFDEGKGADQRDTGMVIAGMSVVRQF